MNHNTNPKPGLKRFLVEWECLEYIYPYENREGMMSYLWPEVAPHSVSDTPKWAPAGGFFYTWAKDENEVYEDFRTNEMDIRSKREAPSHQAARKKLARCVVTAA